MAATGGQRQQRSDPTVPPPHWRVGRRLDTHHSSPGTVVNGYHRPVSRVLSVHRSTPDGHSSRRTVTGTLQQPTRGSPSMPEGTSTWSRRAVSHRLFGLAPAGVCRATAVASRAVGSYPTLSPLPPSFEDGGLLSVALSVTCRSRNTRPGVTWRPALWSPDFPRSKGATTGVRPFTSRPSGRWYPLPQYSAVSAPTPVSSKSGTTVTRE